MNHPDTVFDHYFTSLGNIANKVLAVGGNSSGNNQVEIFDIETNRWTTNSSFAFCSRIFRYAVVSRESSAFIIGGNCDSSYTSRIAKYTLDSWTEVGNLQTTRYGPRAIQNENRIYVVGGEDTQS